MKISNKPITMQDKIIAAIAAYLDENTIAVQDATVWHLQFKKEIDKLFLTKIATEIASAIAPLVEAVEPDWKDAPPWAKYRTVDKNGQVAFWEKQPQPHLLSKYWVDNAGGNRKYCEVDNWQYKIQQRPK